LYISIFLQFLSLIYKRTNLRFSSNDFLRLLQFLQFLLLIYDSLETVIILQFLKRYFFYDSTLPQTVTYLRFSTIPVTFLRMHKFKIFLKQFVYDFYSLYNSCHLFTILFKRLFFLKFLKRFFFLRFVRDGRKLQF
jgi:hypothetical protein